MLVDVFILIILLLDRTICYRIPLKTLTTLKTLKMSSKIVNSKPNRLVFCDDTLNYLMTSENPIPGSVFTSLPDISELPHLFNNNIVNDTNKDLTDKDEIQLEVQKVFNI